MWVSSFMPHSNSFLLADSSQSIRFLLSTTNFCIHHNDSCQESELFSILFRQSNQSLNLFLINTYLFAKIFYYLRVQGYRFSTKLIEILGADYISSYSH